MVRALVIAAAFTGAIVATLWKLPTTFNVTARAESISMVTGDTPGLRWELDNVKLIRDWDSVAVGYTGSLELQPKINVAVERIAHGPLKIRFWDPGSQTSVGTLFDEYDEPKEALGPRAVIIIDDIAGRTRRGANVVMAFAGEITLGRSVGVRAGADPILRSGTVTLLGRSVLTATPYEIRKITLDTGDRFSVKEPRGDSYGFLVADERPGITTVFRTVGKNGIVARFGSRGYEVSMSIWSRIAKDNTIQGVWVAFGALLGFGRYFRRREKATNA